jgi:hypothetical protein
VTHRKEDDQIFLVTKHVAIEIFSHCKLGDQNFWSSHAWQPKKFSRQTYNG